MGLGQAVLFTCPKELTTERHPNVIKEVVGYYLSMEGIVFILSHAGTIETVSLRSVRSVISWRK